MKRKDERNVYALYYLTFFLKILNDKYIKLLGNM